MTDLNKILNTISSMVDEALDDNLKGIETMENNISLAEWKKTNTDGPNGKRLERFRRTKNQMERGLTVEEAFAEYMANKTTSSDASN